MEDSYSKEERELSPVDDELLDWDYYIPVPLNRKRGTIRVTLKYKGRSKPIISDDLDFLIEN